VQLVTPLGGTGARCPELAELAGDNKDLATRLREAHTVCGEYGDVASTSLIEIWIDEAQRRTWFLYDATRHSAE
jgi:starvation-inducible DNA-binding protein